MDGNKAKKIQPSERASIVSQLIFCWALPLFYERYKSEVKNEEYYAPLKAHKSENLGEKLEKAWNKQLSTSNPSLFHALCKTFYLEFITYGSLFILSEFILKMSQPWLIGQLLVQYEAANSSATSRSLLYIYGSLVMFSVFLNVLIAHTYQLKIQHLGMKIRVSCCSLIYRKALKMTQMYVNGTSAGQAVNLLTNDVGRFDLASMHLLQLFVAPFETIIVILCLYYIVGPTAICGIAFLIAFVPIQLYIGKLTAKFRSVTAAITDERLKSMNEVIAAIQVVKMYVWEKLFTKLIQDARKLEIHNIRKTSYLKAINVSSMIFMNRTGIFLCILMYVLTKNQIDAKYVFVISSFYAVLRQTLTVYFPFGINSFSETKVSIERIKKFLVSCEPLSATDELHITTQVGGHQNMPLLQENSMNDDPLEEDQPVGVRVEKILAQLTKSSSFTLNCESFKASCNELVAVTGKTGSGKSALFHVILKELSVARGKLEVVGSVSYAPQEPWLFSGSVCENIVFGSALEKTKYDNVVEVCALKEDFSHFVHGDQTLIGDRGMLLSGGQKARINLARAIYRDADIYLLDNPLAAVDARVGKKIFQECILGYLAKKCTILVTDHADHLRAASRVYKMNEGEIVQDVLDNTYQDLSMEETETYYENKTSVSLEEDNTRPNEKSEERKSGKVAKDVYFTYLRPDGRIFTQILIILFFTLTQAAASGADYFLAFWLNSMDMRGQIDHRIFLSIYASIIIVVIVLSVTRSISFFKFCVRASENLHNDMLSHIIAAPMKFFCDNPSGRILNRFSKDLGSIDELLPAVLMDTIQIVFIVLGSIIIVSFVNPWMLFPVVALFVLFYFSRVAFLSTSRNLKRIEATARSPIYTHMNSTLKGLTTIRTFKAEPLLRRIFDKYQDHYNSIFYMFLTCNRAFGFWLDMYCVLYTFVVIGSIMFTDISAGNVGVSVTQSINLIGVLQWGVRQWSELENHMVTVERAVEYVKISSEKSPETENVPSDWPAKGQIRFESVSLQHLDPDHSALDKVSFTVESNEKIGIVGRTGAGKSSLISVLFRLFDHKGSILIDGVDAAEIPLPKLRSAISIIPQEPILFGGTVRRNLDPFDKYSDEQLWRVLEQVELNNKFLELPGCLQYKVLADGSNFSVGEKHLICLARAILQNNRIFVLDEATANVDAETAQSIHAMIKKNFQNCTILTVAHRIETIRYSDKVLLMADGKAAEFDQPSRLLEDSKSMFSSLVKESGSETVSNYSQYQITNVTNFAEKNNNNEKKRK